MRADPLSPPPLPAPVRAVLQPRWRAVSLLAGAVLLAHALLLGLTPRSAGPGWRADPVRVLQVRRLTPAGTALAAAAPAAATAGMAGNTTTTPAAAHRGGATPAASDPRAAPASDVAADTGADAVVPAAAAEPLPPPGGSTVPVYATQLPPPVTLLYALRRNGQRGSAELQWAPSGSSYRLQLQGRVTGETTRETTGETAGQPTGGARGAGLDWASEGGLDADGIAPERHTESRRGRALRAVNFQRGSGRITFSGPQTEAALVPGTQDRLSWMLQLAGVLAANPSLATPGAQVLLFVAGTRGDAEVWAFDVLGADAVELPDGSTAPALHLQRLPRRPYDTVVDIWLDPARHHLPVRTLLQLRPSGTDAGGTELLLRALQPP